MIASTMPMVHRTGIFAMKPMIRRMTPSVITRTPNSRWQHISRPEVASVTPPCSITRRVRQHRNFCSALFQMSRNSVLAKSRSSFRSTSFSTARRQLICPVCNGAACPFVR